MTAQSGSTTTSYTSATELDPMVRLARAAGMYVRAWATTCNDYYSAAVLYQAPSSLSDAELNRRGLSRASSRPEPTLGAGVLTGVRAAEGSRV